MATLRCRFVQGSRGIAMLESANNVILLNYVEVRKEIEEIRTGKVNNT